jgi:hypothetical protein
MQTGTMNRVAQLKDDGVDIEVMSERDFLALSNS